MHGARRGWNPRECTGHGQERQALPEILSNHPAATNRVQEIQNLLLTVLPHYEAAR
jgi:hypothetical protein